MKLRLSIPATILALCPSVSAAPAAVPESECPDVRASQVDARSEPLGETERCGFGIRILGIGGGILGPQCPDKKVTYPSHQVCRGEKSPGTRCMPDGMLPVTVEDCDCERATVLGTGLLLPDCNCADALDAGHVEDAKTMACHIIIIDPREL